MFSKIAPNIILLTLIAVVIIFLQHGQINRDGVMYLNQAQYFLEGNFTKAMQIYNWPFFSILIVKAHLLTGLSLQYSAHLINICLFLVAAIFYLKNITLVSSNRVSPIFGLLTIISAITLMDDYLGMVLRDHGQWAGFMAGVYFYLRWSQNYSWVNAFLWQFSFLFGSLFRPELLIFNIFLPFISPFILRANCVKLQFIQSIILPLIVIFGGIVFILLNQNTINSFDLARLTELISRPEKFIINFNEPLNITSDDYYLKVLIEDYAISFKYLFFSYVLIYKWFSGLGLFHAVLFIFALKRKIIPTQWFKILSIFFILSALITTVNLFATNVIANRYWVMNWWIVYLVISLSLSYLWNELSTNSTNSQLWVRKILILLIVVHVANILIDKPELHFEQQAGKWIKEQQLDLNNIYFSSNRAAFYADSFERPKISLKTATDTIKYEYLVINLDKFDRKIKKIKNYQLIEIFPDVNKPKLLIYKRNESD